MANTPIYRPLPNSFRMKPKGQFLIKPADSEEWHKGGDYDEFKYSIDIEETEVYSNEFPEKTLALLDITKAEPTISFSARMMTPFLTEVAFMSAKMAGSGMGVSSVDLASDTEEDTKWGPMHEVTFHDVQLRPDGDVILGADGDDFQTQSYVGRCYRDLDQPAGFELGTVVERPRT